MGLIDWVMTGDWNATDDMRAAANQGYVEGWGSFGVFEGSVGQWAYTGEWDPADEVVHAAANSQEAQDFLDCWGRCMASLNKQLAAAAVAGAGASPTLPVPIPKSMVPGRKGLGPKELKSAYTSVARVLQNAMGSNSMKNLANNVKKFPIKTGIKGGAVGLVWAETALSMYCSYQCSEDPCSH